MNTIKRGILYVCLLVSFAFFSQENLIKEVNYYKDTQDSLTIQKINTVSFTDLSASVGFNDAPFWFQIKLKDSSKEPIYLQVKETFLKELELYDSDKNLLHKTSNVKDSNLKIPLENYNKTLYAKVIFDKHSYIDISAYSSSYLEADKSSTLLQRGGFYTLILIFVIVNLFLAYFFKNPLFLWYILFLLSVNLGIALYDNTIANLVQNPKQINYLLAFEYWICPVSAAIFCIKFLDVKQFYPKLITFVKGLLVALTVLIITFLVTENFKVLAYGELIGLTIYVGSWILGFVLIRKHHSAKYYVLGYFVLYFTAFLYSLSVNFGLHLFPLTINHLKTGVILEIIVLTYAIMQRAKNLLVENEEIKLQLSDYIQELKFYQNKTKESTKTLKKL